MIRLIGRALVVTAGLISLATAAYANEPEAVPGEYVIKLKPNLSVMTNGVRSLESKLGSYVKSTIPEDNIVVVKRPVIELRKNVVKSLVQNPYVQYAEPNYIYKINRTPNDPMFNQLWGMKNTGAQDSAGAAGVAGVDIGVEQAWDIQTGSKDVLVAVIDTGIMYNNPDLADNVWTNEVEAKGQAGIDDDNNGYVDDIHGYNFADNKGDNMDDHGHGSHCSGVIGAKGNDGKGIVGVNWDVKIMGVKFLDSGGSGTLENAIKAIDYATKMGAKVLSNSWGGGAYSDTLKEAIDRSNVAGALFVAAAGNESNNNDSQPSYPNSYDIPNILSVAAIDNKGTLASFSNFGRSKVHVGAPGVNIVSTTLAGYESWSGTSMATPHVSGIAALLLANEPKLTSLDLKNRIITTAKPIPGLRGKVRTGAMANAYTALTNTAPQPDPNDPANWSTVPAHVETDHPYVNKAKASWTVTAPGAHEISVYFEKFQTEANYDVVTIKDASGKVITQISGNNDDSFSAVIDGDSATIEFASDDSINYFGFTVSKVAYR
jgi:thermitase